MLVCGAAPVRWYQRAANPCVCMAWCVWPGVCGVVCVRAEGARATSSSTCCGLRRGGVSVRARVCAGGWVSHCDNTTACAAMNQVVRDSSFVAAVTLLGLCDCSVWLQRAALRQQQRRVWCSIERSCVCVWGGCGGQRRVALTAGMCTCTPVCFVRAVWLRVCGGALRVVCAWCSFVMAGLPAGARVPSGGRLQRAISRHLRARQRMGSGWEVCAE
jgi:hypothetical protein